MKLSVSFPTNTVPSTIIASKEAKNLAKWMQFQAYFHLSQLIKDFEQYNNIEIIEQYNNIKNIVSYSHEVCGSGSNNQLALLFDRIYLNKPHPWLHLDKRDQVFDTFIEVAFQT